ncbi:MAG: divergent PAP2 family protein [bacterium]|nr:divergent PAP2 family protein [bacterium]
MEILKEFFGNKAVWVSIATGAIAQIAKVAINLIRYRTFNFSWFTETGGMPSSHSAFVSGVAISVGMADGFDSAAFVVAMTVAIIVVYDAAGVRRAVGKQAEILNEIAELMHEHKDVPPDRLKELIGHTPVEVFVGVLTGIVISVLFYWDKFIEMLW